MRPTPLTPLVLPLRFLSKAVAFMKENRGCATPTATDLGLPVVSPTQASESLNSEDSRPGSANSQHSLATHSTAGQGGLSRGSCG